MNPDIEKQCIYDASRIPTIQHIQNLKDVKKNPVEMALDTNKISRKKFVLYNYKEDLTRIIKKETSYYNYCFISVIVSFVFGLIVGVVLVSSSQNISPSFTPRKLIKINNNKEVTTRNLNSLRDKTENDIEIDIKINEDKFKSVSFTGTETHKYRKDIYPKGLTEDMKDILKDNKVNHRKHSIQNVVNKTVKYVPNDRTVLFDNVYWGPEVEDYMPQGYGDNIVDVWERYVEQSEVVKMEPGCGRMQNRLVTFKDGIQACVRYRQNTDQIQGEIFSFYVGKLLNLTNLAPSVVKVVDLKDKLWRNVAADVSTAQWHSNRAVVLTQYIPSLESATIPDIFKPSNRHLNKNDVLNMCLKENVTSEALKQIFIEKIKKKNLNVKNIEENNVTDSADHFNHIDMDLNRKTIDLFVELAQWSDLIIFDYLTANLDRIVNNLFNYQWNINIMDGPAHNLARKMDSGLLLFLDNESGLLHGYRLLKKYNMYHSLMLDNLCVFRKRTVDALKLLHEQSIGAKLSDMFHKKNNAVIRDVLPPLPEKNAKILHERIGKILSQVDKCELTFR